MTSSTAVGTIRDQMGDGAYPRAMASSSSPAKDGVNNGEASSSSKRKDADEGRPRQARKSKGSEEKDLDDPVKQRPSRQASSPRPGKRSRGSSTLTQPPSPSSAGGTEKETMVEPKGRHRKEWPRVPFVRRPSPGGGPWLPPHGLATNWLNLFYDLAVASVLSTFSNAHELGTPGAIPTFLSYFIIIQWIWATQTYYDIRFQAEDVVHRVYKAAQICLFVYIGAASRAWDLSKLRDPDTIVGISDSDYDARETAYESFTTVVVAFILSRALLAIQYGMSAIVGKQAGRRIRFQISSMITLVISTILTILSLAIPGNSTGLVAAKIVFLYVSIAIEFVVLVLQLYGSLRHHISVAAIAERYGALTLVILGEGGFNSLTRAFNYAISGLSDRSRSTYAQVFLAIGIMFMLYLFLFSWFNPEEAITEKRALAWQAIHLPLHLVILLLMAAMVNTVVVISYAHGLDLVATAFSQTIASITDGTLVSDRERDKIDKYLSRLNLEPDWDSQFASLAQLVNSTQPSDDASIIALQYFGQVLASTTQSYGLQLSDSTYDTLSTLYSINTTTTPNTTLSATRQAAATSSISHLLSEPLTQSLSGTLWLFPCAGAALILAAIRSAIWYRLQGRDHYIVHGLMMSFGLVLGLLGLLDIGQKEIKIDLDSDNTFVGMDDVAPMYLLVDEYVPLVLVLVVYALVYFGATGIMGWMRRREREKESGVGGEREGKAEKAVSGGDQRAGEEV